jgi:hypothetical protein
MPRRPPVVMPRIPLFLILPALKKELKRAGEELVRIVVRRVKGNSYDISVHTQGIEHPLQSVPRIGRPCRKGVTG